MKRKKYEVAGMMEWHSVFRAGRTRIHVSFTGGNLCGGALTAASFETIDPVVQTLIEGSDFFRSGRIRLAHVEEIEDRVPNDDDKLTENKVCERGSVFEYEDIEDVYEFLQHTRGVPLERLCDPDSCFKEAAKLGIILKKKCGQCNIQ